MVVEYIRYTVKTTERGKDLVAAYQQARASLDAAPECLAYELSICEEDPSAYTLRIEWKSTADHLQGFRKGPHFAAFFAAIGGFVKEIAEMRHYQITQVNHRK